jgi:hypothetical protein
MTTQIDTATASLLQAFPLASALQKLVVEVPASDPLSSHIAGLAGTSQTAYAAGLWLFADHLDKAHAICQAHEGTPTFDFWHAILHRREGDFSNSKYWFRRAGNHPAMALIQPSYNAETFVDNVENAHNDDQSPPKLIALQQSEWLTLITWCAANKL